MRKIRVSVSDTRSKTGWTEVTAYESRVLGLIFHHPLVLLKRRWNITHIHSGKSIISGKFKTLKEAEVYTQRWLKSITDWTQTEDQLIEESQGNPARFEKARIEWF